jgi:Metallo-beta-lactamase superfamily
MMADHAIAIDLAAVTDDAGDHLTTLAWGDPVEVLSETPDRVTVRLTSFREQPDGSLSPFIREGRIRKREKSTGRRLERVVEPADASRVLKVDFVDVQQGDGSMVETPAGSVMLIDGGDNQLFARYLAARYRGTSEQNPKPIACIVVSHGDADHFAGLSKIRESEKPATTARKRIFIRPERVFHNGLVKRPSSVKDEDQLGETATSRGRLMITGLVHDLREVPETSMNRPFKTWRATLNHWTRRGPIEIRRLERGDDDCFDFLADEGIRVEVLGPITRSVRGKRALPFLREPVRTFGHPSRKPRTELGGYSASHTINGHSIVLRLTYGKWRILFAGDLNEEAEEILVEAHRNREGSLRSEVFKVPHHGSADFLYSFLEAVAPVVSVISSGDENPAKEYIHPRATLMSGLGRAGRPHEPVLFVTELVAFFRAEGWVANQPPDTGSGWSARRRPFFAFSREAFGLVRVRTDGERLLAYTDSGLATMKEAYAYTLDDDGTAVPEALVRA